MWHTSSILVVGGLSWPAACEILVPRPGIQPTSACIGRQILYHWTIREVPKFWQRIWSVWHIWDAINLRQPLLISRKLEIPSSVFTLAPGSYYNMKLLWKKQVQTTHSPELPFKLSLVRLGNNAPNQTSVWFTLKWTYTGLSWQNW